jgi:hypothetical protein
MLFPATRSPRCVFIVLFVDLGKLVYWLIEDSSSLRYTQSAVNDIGTTVVKVERRQNVVPWQKIFFKFICVRTHDQLSELY